MNTEWILKAVETIKSGIADKLTKDNITIYRVQNIIRIDIKEWYRMTENEIIKEFEKEIKYVKENEKYDDFNPIVDIDLCENVLNIMKLQNEKIKKLNIKNKELSILINMQEKNIKEQQIIIDTLKTLSESAKLEVIKDFENKLK